MSVAAISFMGWTRYCVIAGWALAWACSQAWAVPARPRAVALQQPDGYTFTARPRGDENAHWVETVAGQPIARDAKSGRWVYTKPSGNGMAPTSSVVGRDTPPARWQPGKQLTARQSRRHTSRGARTRASGVAIIPVILVNFPDRVPRYDAADFTKLLFGEGTRSMADYYREVSRGKFTVAPGPGGVVGWYQAKRSHDYYGANSGGVAASDVHLGELVREAVAAAATAGFDFGPYDSDGDGYVDVVSIVHQGTGEESSAADGDIWSQRWDLNEAGVGEYLTPAGVKVSGFIVMPELLELDRIMTIGVFCHEYAHVLNLPDLYDVDGSSEGAGKWSLMAGGVWTGTGLDGDSPAHLDAWSKLKLGWHDATVPTANIAGASFGAVETGGPIYKLINDTLPVNEYFLVENRQRTGFDAALPGSGIVIYHIDDALNNFPLGNAANMLEWYPGHTNSGHYAVAVEQADGRFDLERDNNRGDFSDPYDSDPSGFSASTTPGSNAYSGVVTGIGVRNISASGAVMTADITVAAKPSLAVGNAAVVEGNSGTVQLAFSVVLSAPASGTVTVPYSTADGTARVGVDYTAASGVLTFAPSQTVHTVLVTVRPEAVVEPNETMRLRLGMPGGATLARAEGVGTIINDDTAPVVTQMAPDHGVVGQTITLQGAYLTNATTAKPAVRFGTVAATSVTVDSVARVRAVVPAGAATNYVTLQNSSGTARSRVPFTVVPPVTVTGFSPTSGPVGQTVAITGAGLVNVLTPVPTVHFGGVPATVVTVVAPGLVRAVVPARALTSRISVTNSAGTATSANLFTVTPAPRAVDIAFVSLVSNATVDAASGAVRLDLSGPLDFDGAAIGISVNGHDVAVEGLAYDRAAGRLTLSVGELRPGDRVVVNVVNARDVKGRSVAGRSNEIVVR